LHKEKFLIHFAFGSRKFPKASPTPTPKYKARASVADRLDRIAALKKRIGIVASSKKPRVC
jgi:hypothetical protein